MMRAFVFGCALIAGSALAQSADDAALMLADEAAPEVQRASDWQVFVEAAAGPARLRNGSTIDLQRLSLDVQFDKSFARGWRAVFADRLDMNWRNDPVRQNGINTLKEAYLSWQVKDDQLFDLGRINARFGVATGYNPTDYFRAGANRSIVSADPASLKKNRLGSVMLRSQTLWNGGSLSAAYSPKLMSQPNPAALSPDFGATNNRDRWLLAASHQFSEGINPQFLLFGEERRSPQLGINFSTLLNDATVAYAEWSGGRSPSLLAQSFGRDDDIAFRNRVATGLTYTTADKLSLTVEYQYNGAGLRDAEWSALPRTAPLAYGRYRGYAQTVQDMPTRQALFFYSSWQDVLINHFDLNAMLRINLSDHSRLSWVEARYHWERAELALQWQLNGGDAVSEFGAASQRRTMQAVLRYFF